MGIGDTFLKFRAVKWIKICLLSLIFINLVSGGCLNATSVLNVFKYSLQGYAALESLRNLAGSLRLEQGELVVANAATAHPYPCPIKSYV